MRENRHETAPGSRTAGSFLSNAHRKASVAEWFLSANRETQSSATKMLAPKSTVRAHRGPKPASPRPTVRRHTRFRLDRLFPRHQTVRQSTFLDGATPMTSSASLQSHRRAER